eukprot:466143-Rhodomonas_salina.1
MLNHERFSRKVALRAARADASSGRGRYEIGRASSDKGKFRLLANAPKTNSALLLHRYAKLTRWKHVGASRVTRRTSTRVACK